MKTRPFLDTQVSEVGLGTWQLGGAEWGDVTDEQAFATLNAAADAGVTFIDTADIYGLGRSETLIGKFLEGRADRDTFFIATKLGRGPKPGWPENFTPATVRQHTMDSLVRLGVDRLGLTQTHCIPKDVMAAGDVFATLAELVEEGMIGGWGASVETVEEALLCLEYPGIASLQIIFNIFRQKPIEAVLPKAKEKGVGIVVRLPLASGLLSGKFGKDSSFVPTDHRNFNRDGQKFNVGETFAGLPFEKGLELVEELRSMAPDGYSMVDLAMRWILDFPEVTTVIPGATKPAQAANNAVASDLPPLSPELHAKLANWYADNVAPHIRGAY